MKKTLLLVLLIHTFLFSQIMILKNQDKIIIDNNQTLALNHVNHDQKQILKEHNSIDPRVKKLLEEKPKKDSNLSKEDEELSNKVINTIQTIGNVYNAKDNKERDELIRDLAGNYLSLQANTLIQEYLHALNHSINSEFNLNYNDRGGLSGNAKVLLPIMSEDNPKISYFLQSGIGGYENNRIIGHFGGGIRYYPNALALNNSGNIMLGLNLVYDHDFSREHKRISLGFESMLDTLAFHANIYQRLSDWINSYDFKNANNDLTFLERPANGWDMGVKYAFPAMSNVAIFANMSKWYGEKVAPFGNVNCYEDLEKNPLVYEGGITYSPCPALTFSLSHKRSNESDKQGTNIAMNFNIPLDKDALKHAFDTKLAGINNTIEGSRTHFIDRDYSMVLEYKAINNAYHISYCGNLGDNTHCIMLKNGFNQAVKNVAMSVTPEQRSVILKNGNHYITDDNGKVFVKIIHAYGVHQTNLIAKAGNAQESFPITIVAPRQDFRVFAKPSNIQRHEKSLITFTGSDLASDLDINWKLIGKGSLEKTPNSDKTDKDGNSNIIYKPDINMKDKEKAEIIANVLGVTLKAFVQVAIYGDNDIILDKTTIGNKEKAHASYKNLQAKTTKVKWSIQGDNALFIDKDKTTKELNLIADENGESNVEIIGLSGNEKVKIIAKNMSDELVKAKSKFLKIKNYTATMELPTGKDPVTHQDFEKGMIDYKSDFEVKLKGLMPKTKVSWKAKDIQSNKTLRISNDKESTADDKGESKVVFEGVKDFNIKRLQIIATYNQSAASTQEINGEIKLHQYTPSINFSKDKIHAYESENTKALKDPKLDHVEVTLKGGKPNEKVEWNLSGDATLSNQEATFNASGEAKATITAKAPFKANPTISVNTLGQNLTKTITYDVKTYTPSVNYPSFKAQDKTIDYESDYVLKVSGLLPNSTIDKISGSKGVKAKKESFNVNDKGEATLEFSGISDYSVKELTIKFSYIKQGSVKEEFNLDTIKLYQYTIVFNADPSTIIAEPNKNAEVTVKGGKEGSKVEWNLSGDATLSNQEATFNASGEAKATITAKAPFKANPTISVNTLGQNLTKTLTYVDGTIYTPKIEYPSFKAQEKTIDYIDDFNIKVSGLLPNSTIDKISGSKGVKAKKESFNVNDKGEATLEFSGISDYSVKELTIKFSYMKSVITKSEITADKINLYQRKLSLESNKETIDAYINGKNANDLILDHVEVTLKGGKPNEKVEWNLSGDATLSNQEATFNASGEAKATITAKAPFKANPTISVNTLGQNLTKTITYDVRKFDPVFTYPSFKGELNTIDYKSDFKITVSGLLADSTVKVLKDEKVTPKKDNFIVNDKGETTLEFSGISDYSIKDFKISIEYLKQGDIKDTKTSDTIKLHQYTPSINFSKDKIHAYESENTKALKDPKLDHVEVTLKGGKPNEKVEWNLSGDATLSNQEATFNASGEAKATITAKAPFKANPTISVNTLGQNLTKTITYDVKTYTPSVNYPSFKAQDKTIDYESDYVLKVSGLLPNSTIDNISGSKGVKAKKESFNVNDKGEATLEFSGISDYSIKELTIKFSYIKQGSVKEEFNLDTIKLYQYTIAFNADPSTIIAEPNKNAEVTVKGGKEGSKVEWNLSGDATLTKADKVFNASGEAKATITSKAPFKANPTISVNTLGQNLTKTLTYVDGTIYTPKIEYPSFKAQEKTIDYIDDFNIKVSGLLPNSTIDNISGSKGVKAKKESFNVNDKGEATLEFSGISDYSVKELTIKFSYMKSVITKSEITADKINLYQYKLIVDGSDHIIAEPNRTIKVYVRGGKPNVKIQWSFSGDVDIGDKQNKFDQNGEASVVLIAKAPYKKDIVVKAESLNQTLNKTITYIDGTIYTPKIEYPSYKVSFWKTLDKTIDYDSDYVLKVSGLLPNSTIDNISGSKGVKAKKESFNVNDKGEATLEFSGISDPSVKELTIKFSYMKSVITKSEITADKIKLYQRELNLELDKETLYTQEGDIVHAVLKGGKEGSKVEWNLSGDATLTKADKVFNASGEAKATITAKAPFEKDIIIKVNALGNSLTKSIKYERKIYTPKIEYPSYDPSWLPFDTLKNTIDYKSDYVLKVSGLLPNSTIDNISGSKGVKAKKESFNVNNKGEATLEFSGISDYSVKELTIKFSYMNTGVSKTEFTTDKIKLYQRELEFKGDKTIYTEENTQANITLSGGKSGEKVEWSLSGDATLGSHDTTFNRSGYAYATITAKAPFKTNPVINVNTIGQNVSTTIAYVDKEYTPSIVYPNYRGHEKTVNLNQDFNLEVSNLIPNTEIEIYHNILSAAQPKQDHVKVNSLGKATLEFNGVWIPTVDKFYIKFKYMKTKNKSADFSTDYIYIYKQDVKLVLDVDKDSFGKKEGEVAHAVLKGGKSGEKVEWNLSGDATLGSHDTTFNASGEAKATITSKAPFKANPVIRVSAMGKNLSKELKYKKIPIQLFFSKTVLTPLLIEIVDVTAKGTPNEKIKWSITGDGVLPKEDLIPKYFDSEGFARTKFRTINPNTRPITVSVEYEDGSGKASKTAVFDGPIRPRIDRYSISFDAGATIELYGLVPNSTVEVQPDQYLGYIDFVNKGTLYTDDKGSVYLNFKPVRSVTKHTGRVFKLKVKYKEWDGSYKEALIGDIEVQKQIHATYDSWKDPNSCYISATLTLSNGIAGEEVNFDGTKLIVGLGQTVPIIQRWDKKFDNSGEAKVTISTTWCTKPATETPSFYMRFNTFGVSSSDTEVVSFEGGDHKEIR